MNVPRLKLVRGINFLSLALAVTLWVIFFVLFFGTHGYNKLSFLPSIPYMVVAPLFILCSFILTIKNKHHLGVLLYALFLSLLAQNNASANIYQIYSLPPDMIVVISTAISFTVLIKSLQSFPRQLTENDIKSVFPRSKVVSRYLVWTLKGYIWVVFPLMFVALAAIASYRGGFIKLLVFTTILLTALMCLFVNYKKAIQSERNKILWLFWGLISYSFLVLITVMTELLNGEIGPLANLILTSVKALVLTVSLLMSVFFFDTFDTGTIIRRTVVDGTIFTAIVIIYNTVEHYFLHWLSHTLHLSDALISSFLSGMFVLIFSPIHHKLMHFLQRKIKRHPDSHTNAGA